MVSKSGSRMLILMTVGNRHMNNRWDELTPELQVALTRLINHLASTQDQDRADIVDEFRELLWESFVGECSDA